MASGNLSSECSVRREGKVRECVVSGIGKGEHGMRRQKVASGGIGVGGECCVRECVLRIWHQEEMRRQVWMWRHKGMRRQGGKRRQGTAFGNVA